MILLVPENRVCPGKTTRYPITNHNPVLWIKTENTDYTVISVDGFIVNNENRVNGIFKKFEFIEDYPNEPITLEDIENVFSNSEIQLISQLAEVLQCRFYTFIWPKDYPIGFSQTDLLIHSFTFHSVNGEMQINTHRIVNINDLEQGIRTLRGFSFRSVKNLNSASSNVECNLANGTTNPWPGDIDSLIFNNRTHQYEAIIEFKTHNIDSPIQNERIGKYGQEDWRRFNVLFDLIDNFNARLSYRPKLFFIVWGTNATSENHANVKIDLIERNRVVVSRLFPRPPYNAFSPDLFNYLIQMANETTVR